MEKYKINRCDGLHFFFINRDLSDYLEQYFSRLSTSVILNNCPDVICNVKIQYF